MPRAFIPPHPDTFIAENPQGVRLYAELATVPLYVHVRFIAPRNAGFSGVRRSFHIGWIIAEKRWAAARDKFILPESLLSWAAPLLVADYPSVEAATGYTAADVAELKAEQTAKREAYAKGLSSLL